MRIDTVTARSIPDTRGRATVEATLTAQRGSTSLQATASVPSGKSTGTHEACELRDEDGNVTTAIANVHGEIAEALIGHDFTSANEVDSLLIELDGTPDKSRLGANAILAVSIATQRLFAQDAGIPLWQAIANRAGTTPCAPRLYLNFMNGGVHADFRLPFQEYILVVEGTPSEALSIARETFVKLGERLPTNTPMGDEGGYAPHFDTLEEPFEILDVLVAEFPHTSIAIDAAASEFFNAGTYHLLDRNYSAEELSRLYENLVHQFPMHSIEDPFDEESESDFAHLTASVGAQTLIVGDDFTVTNPTRIEVAQGAQAINAVLIKPNQIGSVKEALEAVQATYRAGFKAIASHRSGETDDTFIADFAYGVGAHGIKAGGLGQRERLEKYERLLEIEQEAQTM